MFLAWTKMFQLKEEDLRKLIFHFVNSSHFVSSMLITWLVRELEFFGECNNASA